MNHAHPTMICNCGIPMVFKESHAPKTKGRKFWGCSKGKISSGGCGKYEFVREDNRPSTPTTNSTTTAITTTTTTTAIMDQLASEKKSVPNSPLNHMGSNVPTSPFQMTSTVNASEFSISVDESKMDEDTDMTPAAPIQNNTNEVKCFCGLEANHRQVKKADSKFFGQWFYACPKAMGSQCKYWETETQRKARLEKEKKTPDAYTPLSKIGSCSKPTTGFDQKFPYTTKIEAYRQQFYGLDNDQVSLDPDVEKRFIKIAKKNGFEVRTCTNYERIHQHTDFELSKGEKKSTLAFVKLVLAEWCEDKKGKDYDSIFLCVKDSLVGNAGFVNVGKGDEMGTRAQMIAFENLNGFYILNPRICWSYIEKCVSNEKVSKKENAWNKIFEYPGSNRQDTRVKIDDLRKFKSSTEPNTKAIAAFWSNE